MKGGGTARKYRDLQVAASSTLPAAVTFGGPGQCGATNHTLSRVTADGATMRRP